MVHLSRLLRRISAVESASKRSNEVPIYEYTCKSCNKKFEKLLRTMAEQVVACPSCGSKKTERQLSVFAVSAEGSRHEAMPSRCQQCSADGHCPMQD